MALHRHTQVMANRLANETSPYLLQHQNNPVDWYPWGEEAFAKAKSEDKPIFLSVGYSSCHWCHVMEHESFEDSEVANRLNNSFVSVKVDREERPDVDEAYMAAVQLASGRGGWPMSVFMTPDREPFFAATYIPKEPRDGHPGFVAILEQLTQVWKDEREKVREIAGQFTVALRQSLAQQPPESAEVGPQLLDACVKALEFDFDEDHGGFGPAPKFPPHTAIELLLNYAISELGTAESRDSAADMALFTLERMALGGIHDHVGGGFHRYSTDGQWLLPHFEKMLYDNALLLGNYARAAALCHEQIPDLESLFSRTADGIVRFLIAEMTSPEGLFYSALDADSEGEEGKFYVWTETEVGEALASRSSDFLKHFQFHSQGNFRDEATGQSTGTNIPHLLEPAGDRFDQDLQILGQARSKRVKPGLDDKAIVGWNGLAISALAEAAELEMAERAANAILRIEREYGRLPHQIAKGKPSGEAFLDDYAYLIDGLVSLAGVKALFKSEGATLTGRPAEAWLKEARRLAKEMLAGFYDEESGNFFGTSDRHEELFGRTKQAFDQPVPSPNAIAAKCLVELDDRPRAERTLRSFAGWMERAPTATESLHLVLLRLLGEGIQDVPKSVDSPQEISVRARESRIPAVNGVAEGLLEVTIPSGLHINSAEPPANWLVATEVTFEPKIGSASFPSSENHRYEGLLEIPISLELAPGLEEQEVEISVRYQACTETECLLPHEARLTVTVYAT